MFWKLRERNTVLAWLVPNTATTTGFGASLRTQKRGVRWPSNRKTKPQSQVLRYRSLQLVAATAKNELRIRGHNVDSEDDVFRKEDVEPENAAIGGLQRWKRHFEDSSFGRQPPSLRLPEPAVYTHQAKNKPQSVPQA